METERSKVFVVDADPITADSIQELVVNMPVEVEAFSNAEEFLNSRPEIHFGCLVTELRLSGMSGLELLRVTGEWPLPPVTIVLTGHADIRSAVAAMQLGAYTLLEKPCVEHHHWDALRKALLLERATRAKRKQIGRVRAILAGLSAEERELIEMILEGAPNKSVAARMDISVRTVETRRRKLFRKFGTKSVAQLVALIVEADRERSHPSRQE